MYHKRLNHRRVRQYDADAQHLVADFGKVGTASHTARIDIILSRVIGSYDNIAPEAADVSRLERESRIL